MQKKQDEKERRIRMRRKEEETMRRECRRTRMRER